MNHRKIAILMLLAFVCVLAALPLCAQTQATTGVIQGKVEDPTGAVMPGATVQAKNLDTNFSRQVTTDSDGRFVLLALPPGRYTVTVTAKQGFAKLEQTNLNLTVGQAIALNLQMKIAQGNETVIVNESPLIDAVKTEASTTLDQAAISSTPVLGRKFEDLLTLTPGVSVSQGPDGDEINFNGQRGIFNNISLDGGDYNNGFFGEQMGGQRAAIDIALEAVGEFQVVASGASAEFGRTAGGVVNVVTKSGTNDLHGSLFHYQRLEGLSSSTSDGQPLSNFSREQFGGSISGPIRKDKLFFSGAFEQIIAELERPNLGLQLGSTPCPVATPTLAPGNVANENLIVSNPDCQRLALVNFYQTNFSENEAAAIPHPVRNSALLGKLDWTINPSNKLSGSYNFDYSKNSNQTFDVATYGASANGTEGPSKIQAVNLNFFTTASQNTLNEAHFTYSRENRPRGANGIVSADTGIGFGPSFRFGNPFFLNPNVDELFWRGQFKDNVSVVHGSHTYKFGGEWIHSRNAQVFRGFFQGRYIFDSVNGFLRYAQPTAPGGFGPTTVECVNNSTSAVAFQTGGACPAGSSLSGPLLLYLQGAALNGPATDATGASDIANEDFAIFAQDKWQVTRNFTLNYGLRWEAQTFPDPTVAPNQTAYASLLNNPLFPSNGTLPNQWKQFQPRVGFAWDLTGKGKSVWRASAGIYNGHQNMLSQVSSITTNGVQQQTLTSGSFVVPSGGAPPPYPKIFTTGIGPTSGGPPGVHIFDRNYHNPRIYAYNTQFEQEIIRNLSMYADFSWSKGVYLTDFPDYNRADRGYFPSLGSTIVTASMAHSDYRGVTIGARKRLSNHFQMEANYVYSHDYDNDSNERDPFTDYTGPALSNCSATHSAASCFPLNLDWSPSARDIRHKFNAYMTGYMPWGFEGNLRLQVHSAEPNVNYRGTDPITGLPANVPRNFGRKDNAYSSADWRLSRPFKFGDRYQLIPQVEMFNTFNSANNVNTLSAPALFDFNGFLRVGVGDPREVQLSVKFKF